VKRESEVEELESDDDDEGSSGGAEVSEDEDDAQHSRRITNNLPAKRLRAGGKR